MAGLAFAAIGGLIGYLVGGRTRTPEAIAAVTEPKKTPGGTLLSIVPATNDDGNRIAEAWEAIGGENIHH